MGFETADIYGLASLPKTVDLLVTSQGLIRSPTTWNKVSDTSRDQTRPMMIAMGMTNYFSDSSMNRLNIFLLKPKGLIGRYPNGDIASPENWNEWRRAIGKEPTWLGDLNACGDASLRCYQASKDLDDVGDDLNTLLTLVFFYLVKPTHLSKQALIYYLINRPPSYGTLTMGEVDHVLGALAWYFRKESGGNPYLAEMWREPLKVLRSALCP
jgi:hypothetical protein